MSVASPQAAPPAAGPAASPRRRGIALLTADPGLAAALPPEQLAAARRLVAAPREDHPVGPWTPHSRERYGDGTFALLIISGLLMRDTVLGGRSAAQLFGPGDVIDPWPAADRLLPAQTHWRVSEPMTLAVLDRRFDLAARRWPQLQDALRARIVAQSDRAILHAALGQLPRVELRIVALLWHLAERWGRAVPAGVHIPLRLTHETLGRLVGAQRPTVTLALSALAEEGIVVRDHDCGFVLDRDSQGLLMPAAAPAAVAPVAMADAVAAA